MLLPAFCRFLVSGVFQLPVLCCYLFLDSLLSQPSNTQSVVPISSFKLHKFLDAILCGAAPLLLSDLSLLHPDLREESPSFSVPILLAIAEILGTDWGVFQIT